MGLKSVIDVDVNDEEFKLFADEFEKYQTRLRKMPGAWAGVDKATKTSFETVAAAMLAQQEVTKKLAKNEKDFAQNSKHVAVTWRGLVHSTKSVATNIKDATTSLLRWVGVGSIFSGLIGAGGLFGLDLLAASAGSQRRGALGLGVSVGEKRAFGLNFGRVIDPESYLSGVNAALHDVTKRSILYSAGLNEGQIAGKDTAQVSEELIPALKKLADRTPQALLGQVLQSRGLDQLISLQDFERLKNTPASELGDYLKSYRRDRKNLNLDDRSLRAWQDFDVQLSRAGQRIESAFIRGLDPLIRSGAFTKLSDAIASSVDTLLSSPDLKKWLSELGDGIKGFAGYVASPKFQSDLKEFAQDVSDVASGLTNALRWLNLIPDHAAEKAGVVEKSTGVPFVHALTGKNGKPLTKAQWAAVNHNTPQFDVGGWIAKAVQPYKLHPTEASVQAMLKEAFPNIRITEGFSKSKIHVKNSMHGTGEALDEVGVSKAELSAYLKKIGFPYTELLDENYRGTRHGVPSTGPHVHLGWRPKPPHTQTVKVEVNNNTGGSAIVASNQIAQ